MPGKESRYPADWLHLAEKDLNRVARALRDDDPELAGFCLQQAVEKFLKAFLLTNGWRLKRIHDLGRPLDEARTYDPDLTQFREACQRITDYYVVERYPLIPEAGPSLEEVQRSVEAAGGLIERIRNATR